MTALVEHCRALHRQTVHPSPGGNPSYNKKASHKSCSRPRMKYSGERKPTWRAPTTSRGVGRGLLVNTHAHNPNLMMPSSSNRMLPRQIYRFILCDDYLPTSYMIHNYPTQERIPRILGVILCFNITRIRLRRQ